MAAVPPAGGRQMSILIPGTKTSQVEVLTREKRNLADEQPLVGEEEFTAEDLGRAAAEWQRDGSGRGVLQVLQGHGQREGRRGPGLEDPGFEHTLHSAEDPDALSVSVVAVHLEKVTGRGPIRTQR